MEFRDTLKVNYEIYLKRTVNYLEENYNLRLEKHEENANFILKKMSAISKGIDSDNGTDKNY